MGWAYYNEIDEFACAWLAELMADGVIAEGIIDGRSIVDVQPEDLKGFSQCHFFAGIGGWNRALRLAGIPDDANVWTGSCPCQPFSNAGKQRGESDERHLWPEFQRLIAGAIEPPSVVFGEQVASKLGRDWLARVRADLEAMEHGVGSADLCAAGVGAPHIRQRLYWMAYPKRYAGRPWWLAGKSAEGIGAPAARTSVELGRCGVSGADIRLADTEGAERTSDGTEPRGLSRRFADGGRVDFANSAGWLARFAAAEGVGHGSSIIPASGCDVGMEHTASDGREQRRPESGERCIGTRCEPCGLGDADDAGSQGRREHLGEHADKLSAWSASVLVQCSDGKARRTPVPESGIFPLAYGVPNRVGTLRGSGNAIVGPLAAWFVHSCKETCIEVMG